MELKTATDWHPMLWKLRDTLYDIADTTDASYDLYRLLNNITDMVTAFSKLEVDARRIHKDTALIEPRANINSAIKRLDQLILVAILMK